MRTTASALLRQARRAGAFTQRALAAASGDTQSAIADVETGRHDPGVDRLERLVRPLGYQVTIIPTRRSTAGDAADRVATWLQEGEESRAVRAVLQLNDDLASESPAVRVALAVTPPAPTGDRRFDALIAAVVEHQLRAEKLPLPEWVHAADRRLDQPWVVDRLAGGDVAARTPRAFRRHNVLIDPIELASV